MSLGRQVIFVLSVLLAAFHPHLVRAELRPDQIMIVANADVAESQHIAEHYAATRGVPRNQIVVLKLSKEEQISRSDYENALVLPLRETILHQGLGEKIRVLLLTYGIPLRVAAVESNEEERLLLKVAKRQRLGARAELDRLRQSLSAAFALTSSACPNAAKKDLQSATDNDLLRSTEETFAEASKKLEAVPSAAMLPLKKHFAEGILAFGGIESLLRSMRVSEDGNNAEATRAGLSDLQDKVKRLRAAVFELRYPREQGTMIEFYRHIERLEGLRGVLGRANHDIRLLSSADSDASVDSELSLLWWDRSQYRSAGQLLNPLYHERELLKEHLNSIPPILMTSRIDAPTAGQAANLVDLSLKAERNGPQGVIYIDARGLEKADTSFFRYDSSLGKTARLFREHTPHRVVYENTDKRFSKPGEAPDVLVYIGWYRLRQYEDAFFFRPGAIGIHIASEEAVSIHNPEEPGWCKNALERGITATVGAVAEPYLDSFPLPHEFSSLLLSGRYSLVETYALTSKYMGWRLVLFGDPLYNPWRKRNDIPPTVLEGRTSWPDSPAEISLADPASFGDDRNKDRRILRDFFERFSP